MTFSKIFSRNSWRILQKCQKKNICTKNPHSVTSSMSNSRRKQEKSRWKLTFPRWKLTFIKRFCRYYWRIHQTCLENVSDLGTHIALPPECQIEKKNMKKLDGSWPSLRDSLETPKKFSRNARKFFLHYELTLSDLPDVKFLRMIWKNLKEVDLLEEIL